MKMKHIEDLRMVVEYTQAHTDTLNAQAKEMEIWERMTQHQRGMWLQGNLQSILQSTPRQSG